MLFPEQWVNTWWLAWCSRKKKTQLICLRFLANGLVSIAGRCGRFPGFCNWDGSGLTGQKDLKNIERNGKKIEREIAQHVAAKSRGVPRARLSGEAGSEAGGSAQPWGSIRGAAPGSSARVRPPECGTSVFSQAGKSHLLFMHNI